MATHEQQLELGQVAAAEAQIVEQTKRIDFYITEYSVELLAQKMHDVEYVVPSYQREFTWEPARKSKFIESVMMGLPIPFMFFWEMPDGRLEIVDGSQRLRTIQEFILGGFRLTTLDQLTHSSGLQFLDLPASRQRKIKNRSIRGIVLNEHADEAARLDMFDRINTGSKNANTAEIRRGAASGPFLNLVIRLSGNELLQGLAPISKKMKDERGYEELVTRFFAYGDGLSGYRDRPSDFLFDYSKKMNQKFQSDSSLLDLYERRFIEMIEFVARIFPFGFRKTKNGKATPRARFESIAIGSEHAFSEVPALLKAEASDLNVETWLLGPKFQTITGSDGANAISRLQGRINFVSDRLIKSWSK